MELEAECNAMRDEVDRYDHHGAFDRRQKIIEDVEARTRAAKDRAIGFRECGLAYATLPLALVWVRHGRLGVDLRLLGPRVTCCVWQDPSELGFHRSCCRRAI